MSSKNLMLGYLKTKRIFGSWTSYYFILKSDGTLCRAKAQQTASNYEVVIKLDKETQVIDGKGLSGKQNSIAVLHTGITPIVLLAPSAENQKQWIQVMKDLTSDSGESTDTIDVAHTLEALNDPTVAADTKGNILGFNSAAEKLFGYRRDEIIGKNVKILMPDNYASHHDRYLLQYLVSQEKKLIGCPRALIAVTKSKENIPIILSLGEIESAGFKYYIAVFKSSIDDKGSMSIASQDDDTEDSEGLSLGSPSGCPMSTSSCPLGHIRLIGELDDSMDKFKNMMHHEWQQMINIHSKQQKMIETLEIENKRMQQDLQKSQLQISHLEDILNQAQITSSRLRCTQLLNLDSCYQFFLEYCKSKQCGELCMFYHDVQLFKKKFREAKNIDMKKEAQNIIQLYILSSSPHEINVSSLLRDYVIKTVVSPTISMFDSIIDDVLSTLQDNCLEAFLKTGVGKVCKQQLSNK